MQPAFQTKSFPSERRLHFPASTDQSDASRMLVNSASPDTRVLVDSGSSAQAAHSNASRTLEGQAPCGGGMHCDYCGGCELGH